MTNLVAIWIWFCAYLNCAGWFLSAIRQLNGVGYAVALTVWVASLFIIKKAWPPLASPFFNFRKFSRRFKRPFPFAFLILTVMVFIGGAIYAPNNYDGLTYRLPRVLHWLAAGQWYWIHTAFPRLNNRACGIEWVSAPLIALFKTDRLLFLINFIPFLFLPGLVFSVLTRLGVRRRVAWHWMWIAPTGYCFLLQAGGIANDSFAAPFALAAIDFALRAKISKSPRDLFSSVLAAALLTATKTGNMTLLLPWAIAILPCLKFFLRRPITTAIVCIIAIFSSFLPNAVINARFSNGDWSGLAVENIKAHGPVILRTAANVALITVLNVMPPVFPEANRWNSFVQKIVPPKLNLQLQQTLTEPGAAGLYAPEMQMEENAALGLGLVILIVVSVLTAALHSGKSFFKVQFHSAEALWRAGIVFSPWVSLLALLSQSEVYPIGRIAAPYYILLLPSLLASPVHEQLVKRTWWRIAGIIVFFVAGALLVIFPARPLFPAAAIFEKINASHPNSRTLGRIAEVYAVYHNRGDAFAPALDILPPGLKVLGFITYDDPETSLWFPLGSRTIFHVRPDDGPNYLKDRGIEYILAKSGEFNKRFPDLNDWLKKMNAQVVQTIQLNLRAADGPRDWYLIKLN